MSLDFSDISDIFPLRTDKICIEAIKDLHSLLYVTSVATHYTSCCVYMGYFEHKMDRGLINKLDTAQNVTFYGALH